MEPIIKGSILFGVGGFAASLPIVWYFWGMFAVGAGGNAVWWGLMPVLAVLVASLSFVVVLSLVRPVPIGPGLGAVVALVALFFCTLIFCLPAVRSEVFLQFFAMTFLYIVVMAGWLVAITGAMCGWVYRHWGCLTP